MKKYLKKATIGITGAALAVSLYASPVQAGNPMTKLGNGIEALIKTPFEFPVTIIKVAKERSIFDLVTFGVIEGVLNTKFRAMDAVYETATFHLPNPGTGYEPIYDRPIGEPLL